MMLEKSPDIPHSAGVLPREGERVTDGPMVKITVQCVSLPVAGSERAPVQEYKKIKGREILFYWCACGLWARSGYIDNLPQRVDKSVDISSRVVAEYGTAKHAVRACA